MKHTLLCALVGSASVLVGACGDGGGGNAADAAPQFDARPIDRTDRVYLFQTVTLPRTQEEVDATAFLYPNGNRPLNKLGGLTSVLLDLLEGIDVQGNINGAFTSGESAHILVVSSGPLDEQDPGLTIRFGQVVVDTEDPPNFPNNFDGTGQVRLADGQELFVIYNKGSLDAGEIEMEGDLELDWGFDLKLDELEDTVRTGGVGGRVRLHITEDGFTGESGSMLTPAKLVSNVYPSTAKLLTRAIAEGKPRAAAISGIYDANGDGEVTVEELVNNDQQASLAQPDIDLDGDGTNDHLSQGVFFSGVRVELVE